MPEDFYDDGCRTCGRTPTKVKLNETITIQVASSGDVFGPFEANSYYCEECFTRMLQELISRLEPR